MTKKLSALFAAVALAAMPTSAWAEDDTMAINATVVRSCHLAALPMMFGTLSLFLPTGNAQAPIFIDCTPNTTFTVAIDNGENATGTQRRMARIGPGIGNFLNYEIYSNAARTTRWGTSPAQVVTRVAPANGKVTLFAYGRATGGLIVSGPFEDTVTVTLVF